jgi:hypothetical protein
MFLEAPCTPASGPAEWVKILLSALAGMIAGTASGIMLEPMKFWIQRRYASKRAEKGILSELANIYEFFCVGTEGKSEGILQISFEKDMSDTFQYYYTNHREACYQIKWKSGIRPIYSFYNTARSKVIQKEITSKQGSKMIQDGFSWCFRTGLLPQAEILGRVEVYLKDQKRRDAAIVRSTTRPNCDNPDSESPHS